MLLGALVDAGAPTRRSCRRPSTRSASSRSRLRARQVTRAGLAATQVEVAVPAATSGRTWPDVRGAARGRRPRRRRCATGRWTSSPGWPGPRPPRTASTRSEVHFHEVGALDALADVVGVCAALHDLGVDATCAARRSRSGSGTVRTEHGAAAGARCPRCSRVLAEAGAPVGGRRRRRRDVHADRRGAARGGGRPAGAGCRRCGCARPAPAPAAATPTSRPNVLRVVLGEPRRRRATPAATTTPSCSRPTSTTSTRGSGRRVLAALLAAGASDAWLTPILMKKGRPAHTLSVLVPPPAAGRRAPGRVHRELDDRRARAPGRQAGAGPRDADGRRSTASTSG